MIRGEKENFCLEGKDGKHYIFIPNLPIVGDNNVTVHNESVPPATFTGVHKEIASLKWMDSKEDLTFIQDAATGIMTMNTTGFRYGVDHVVRVAEMTFKNE